MCVAIITVVDVAEDIVVVRVFAFGDKFVVTSLCSDFGACCEEEF